MKVLVFSDLHCSVDAANSIVERSSDVDCVVGAGDFANIHKGIERTIDVLKRIIKPTIVVPGNNETLDELRYATNGWPSVHVLHGSGVEINGKKFFGIGCGIPVTPFGDWSFDLSESEATKILDNCEAVDVLVSHSPPNGIVDRSAVGESLGSQAVLATIVRCQPQLVVCGHIHDSAGQSESRGPTTVINAGPGGAIIELS